MGQFIQNEILGMAWLQRLIGSLLRLCGLDTESRVGGSVLFFLYDTIKIMLLLGVLILLISYIQSYFPPERSKKLLGRFNGMGARIIAALLGTVTPFCSCSSIPLFIGFTSAGLPLGVTFSFLISSPMVDLGSLVLLMSIFGWKVAAVYVVLGLVIAVAGGTLIERLRLGNQVQDYIRSAKAIDIPQEELRFSDRLKYAWGEVLSTAKKVFVGRRRPRRQQSLRRGDRDGLRHPDVRGHLRHHSDRRGASRQGRAAGRGAVLYDGRDDALAAVDDHAQKGGQDKAAGYFYRDLRGGYHHRWLRVQRPAIFADINNQGISEGKL